MKKILLLPITIILFVSCNKTNLSKLDDGIPQIAAVDSSVIAMPDIFTPNGDGINDIQFVLTRNIQSINFTFSKKSGSKIFESTDMNSGWDGTTNGKYSKEKEYDFTIDAMTVNGKTLSLSGSFVIILNNCAKGSIAGCFFSTQFNGTTFDANLPSGESIKSCI